MEKQLGLCWCGCGQPTKIADKTRGLQKKGLPNRFLDGHNGQFNTPKKPNRYEVDPDTGCWNWLLYKNKKGYGLEVLGHGKQKRGLAHREMWKRVKGEVLPSSITLDHLCGNTSCVNPDHMEPVTFEENTKRKEGTSSYCPSLNFIVIRAMNEWKRFINSLKSPMISPSTALNAVSL